MSRHGDLNRFYAVLNQIHENEGGFRYLRDCTGSSGWPERGLYFFFEEGEYRDDARSLRVVRVVFGTGDYTELWTLEYRSRDEILRPGVSGSARILRCGSPEVISHCSWNR
jgi:hypothetical protein